MQSLSLVYLIFNFGIHSLVFKIATLVNRAVLFEIIIAAHGLIEPVVEELIAEAEPIIISVIITSIFFVSKFYISSYKIHYQF